MVTRGKSGILDDDILVGYGHMPRRKETINHCTETDFRLEEKNRIDLGLLEMRDGTMAAFLHVYQTFTGLKARLSRPDGLAALRDMYKLATGQAISPEQQAVLRENLDVRDDGTLVEPTAYLLLLGYGESPQGKPFLEEPWKDNAVNAEVIRRGLGKQYEKLTDMIRRGPNDESDVPTWDRN
jgi:hypothetical protein